MAKTSAADLLRMKQILDSGIPLDEGVVKDLQASCRGLSLWQTGSPMENEVFDLEFNGFGFIASIGISNDSPNNIRILQYRLEQQWPEPGFHWLEDPWRKVPREYSYSFPKHGPMGLGREFVLNHRIARQHSLARRLHRGVALRRRRIVYPRRVPSSPAPSNAAIGS